MSKCSFTVFNGNAHTKIDSLCLNHSIEFVFTQFSSRGALKFVFKISVFFFGVTNWEKRTDHTPVKRAFTMLFRKIVQFILWSILFYSWHHCWESNYIDYYPCICAGMVILCHQKNVRRKEDKRGSKGKGKGEKERQCAINTFITLQESETALRLASWC